MPSFQLGPPAAGDAFTKLGYAIGEPEARAFHALLAPHLAGAYSGFVITSPPTLSLNELRTRLRGFCEKHRIRRLEVFGSAARGAATAESDVDLLVTFDDDAPVETAELLEMAGEAEELVGRPVDFVLRGSIEKSPNQFAREHILATAVCVYGG
jgi:hypothetical protein